MQLKLGKTILKTNGKITTVSWSLNVFVKTSKNSLIVINVWKSEKIIKEYQYMVI